MQPAEHEQIDLPIKVDNGPRSTLGRLFGRVEPNRKHRLVLIIESPVRRESLHFLLANVLEECTVESYAGLDEISREQVDLMLVCQSSIPRAMSEAREYIDAVKAKFASVALLVMSDEDDIELASAVLRCGAKGYVMASLGTSAFVAAIRLAMAGGVYVPTSLIEYWTCGHRPTADSLPGDDLVGADQESSCEAVSSRTSPATNVFTLRELDVIEQLKSGQPKKLIAYGLNMSESTVKVHMRNIMRKLGATNRTQVAFYVRGGVAPAPSQRVPSMVAQKLSTSSTGRATSLSGMNSGSQSCLDGHPENDAQTSGLKRFG